MCFLILTLPLHAQKLPLMWLRDGSKKRTLKFEHLNGLVILEAKLPNKSKVRLILDTGAEQSIFFKKQKIDALQMEYERQIIIYGSDLRDSVTALVCRQIPLAFSARDPLLLDMLVLDQSREEWEAMIGKDIDGILGADFLKFFTIKLDYAKSRITFYDNINSVGGLDRYTEQAVTFIKNKPYLSINCPDIKADSIDILLDTGCSLDFIFIYGQDHISLPEHIIPSSLGLGLGGEVMGYKGRVAQVSIFQQNFNDMVVNYQTSAHLQQHLLRLDPKEGLVGGQVLDRFNIIIDYQRKKIYTKPNPRIRKRFWEDRSGLSLIAAGQDHAQVYVLHAWPNTPASEAGIQKGDEILQVGNFPFVSIELKGMRNRLAKRGEKKVRVKINRFGRQETKILRLRDLL